MIRMRTAPSSIPSFVASLAALAAVAIGLGLPALSSPAWADEALPDSAGGRYVFQKQADGVVRLDTQTGEVSLCNQKAVGWACEAAPDDRALLESEIARLQRENVALKKDMLARGLPLPPGAVAEPPAAQNGVTLRLPTDADIDRMVALAGHLWHRIIDAVERAQKQILNKS